MRLGLEVSGLDNLMALVAFFGIRSSCGHPRPSLRFSSLSVATSSDNGRMHVISLAKHVYRARAGRICERAVHNGADGGGVVGV